MSKIIDQYLVLLCDMPLYDSGTKFALTMDGEIYLVDPQDDTKLGPLVYTKEQRLEMGDLEDYFIDCGNLNFPQTRGALLLVYYRCRRNLVRLRNLLSKILRTKEDGELLSNSRARRGYKKRH